MDDRFSERLGRVPQWERTQILATLQRVADMMDTTGDEEFPALANGWTESSSDLGSAPYAVSRAVVAAGGSSLSSTNGFEAPKIVEVAGEDDLRPKPGDD
jgi:hypothetical protein